MPSLNLLDLPEPLLSQIVQHSKDRRTLQHFVTSALLCVSRQTRDAVLRVSKRIQLFQKGEHRGAALDPYARLLGRASSFAACEDLHLYGNNNNDVLDDILLLLSPCTVWPSVQKLKLHVSLSSLGRQMLLP
jgi:hypothetical protein